jgi:hypothetical protein
MWSQGQVFGTMRFASTQTMQIPEIQNVYSLVHADILRLDILLLITSSWFLERIFSL